MAKRQVKNKKASESWKKYKVEGGKVIRSKCCPRCGQGYFLADHKDRWFCGKCHYQEMKKKE